MGTFAIICTKPGTGLAARVAEIYPSAHYVLSDSACLIVSPGVTAKEICAALHIEPGGFDNTVVFRISSYYGFASAPIWEWLAVKATETPAHG